LWVVIPLAIWLDDRGPVFYTQLRVGKGGKPFTVIKFRTMVRGADRVVRPWTLPGRDHVTRVGSLLRPMALDELPQVLNILRGEMSLVGPRAMPVEEYAVYQPRIPGFNRRFGVRPGLTGMAQVCARAIRNNHEKLVHDLEYVDHMSLWLDIRLLLLSVFNTVRRAWETPHACRTPRAAQPWHRAAPRAVALPGRGSAVPFWALMSFTVVLLLSPQTFLPELARLRIALLTGGLAVAAHCWTQVTHRRPLIRFTREVWIAVVLLGWAALSLPLSTAV